MPVENMQQKWDSRYREGSVADAVCATVVSEHLHLLPPRGNALELACGLGGNAVMLARHGLDTTAWDISTVAIEKLATFAQQQQLSINAQVRDVINAPPVAGSFDVIVVTHFLERNLSSALVEALRPGGLLFYQTFVRNSVSDRGPSNPEYRLAPNELLHMFSMLQILTYCEEDTAGDTSQGFRDEALLIGMKT